MKRGFGFLFILVFIFVFSVGCSNKKEVDKPNEIPTATDIPAKNDSPTPTTEETVSPTVEPSPTEVPTDTPTPTTPLTDTPTPTTPLADTPTPTIPLVETPTPMQEETSGWVLESEVPSGAKIVDRKWTYDSTETTESTDSALSGWTQTDSYWKETGSESMKYASFPETFNQNSEVYKQLNNSPYEANENENSKRVVENKEAGFVYWHWMYNVVYSDNTQRTISDRQGSFDASGNSGGYAYQYFDAFLSDVDCPYLDNLYCCNRNQPSYNCVNVMPDKSSVGTGTPRYFRFKYYVSTYTDYEKVYKYSRTTTKESSNEIPEEGVFDNVQVWVKYVMETPTPTMMPLVITEQPKSVSGPKYTEVAFTIKVDGEGPFTYQWQYQKPGESAWINVEAPSATTSVLETKIRTERSSYMWRCVVKDVHGNNVVSNTVTMTIE